MAISLPTVVEDYIDAVVAALNTGSVLDDDPSIVVNGAAQNYVRAMDLANILDLLMDALDQTSALTATGGSTTTVVDGAATFVAGAQVGNYVTFATATEASIVGLTRRVVSNTATTLTLDEALPATVTSGDTYTLRGGFTDEAAAALRQDASLGLSDSPRGNVYGDARLVQDALVRIVDQLGGIVDPQATVHTGTLLAGSTASVLNLDLNGEELRPGQFVGLSVDVTGFDRRKIVNNDETTVTVSPAYGSAPGTVAYRVVLPNATADFEPNRLIHPGGHPKNRVLANLIEQAVAAVEAFTLPT